jgi:hypothetical protein
MIDLRAESWQLRTPTPRAYSAIGGSFADTAANY